MKSIKQNFPKFWVNVSGRLCVYPVFLQLAVQMMTRVEKRNGQLNFLFTFEDKPEQDEIIALASWILFLILSQIFRTLVRWPCSVWQNRELSSEDLYSGICKINTLKSLWLTDKIQKGRAKEFPTSTQAMCLLWKYSNYIINKQCAMKP